MSNGLKIGKGVATLIIGIGILAAVGIMLACVPSQTVRKSLPVSPWGDKYFYSYEPPEKQMGSIPLTIAIVDPSFPKVELDPIYRKVAKGFAKSMAIDLDKIIVAKGMTVTGPFENLDMMTYPDKKNAVLSLTPEIFINVQTSDITGWRRETLDWFVKSVQVKVDVWVTLIMREPLSSEKIWIKKIEVGEDVESAEIYAGVVDLGPEPGYKYVRRYGPGKVLYDGRTDAVASIIKKMYPKIMDTIWRYINTEEILVLKEKAEEIRSLKRY